MAIRTTRGAEFFRDRLARLTSRPAYARYAAALAVCAVAGAVTTAQQPAESAQQDPFRTTVDIIRIDASVLDKDRKPVRGLTAADFTVLENGRPQRIVAVTEVDAVANDPTPSAWMRYATRDVTGNDLADQLGDGQAIAIVMDDDHIPFDDSEIIVATRATARYIVNSLAPSDLAAVIFPVRVGNTQDFTNDRSKLLEAIDRFIPQEQDSLAEQYRQQPAAGRLQGDMQRYSPILGRDPCLQNEPVLPALRTATARLSTIPNQRKTVIFLSTGSPVRFQMGGSRCQGILYQEMRETFRQAQRYNVNIHSVDPAGARGMENYLTKPHIRDGRMAMPSDTFDAHQTASRLQEFLKVYAEQTGGHASIDGADLEAAVDQIFAESASYYLIGYETSNGNPDGKFRRIEVKVRDRDLDVRTKNGFWAPDKNDPNSKKDTPTSGELSLSGLAKPQGLPLRVVVHPIARLANGEVDVAAVLTVRVPARANAVQESLTLVRTANDLDGRIGRPVQQKLTRTIDPGSGDVARYDVLSHFPLAPGRYEIRFNATSALADGSGTVYADLEIPDLGKAALTVPGVALGVRPEGERTDPLAGVMPIVPTTSRDFTKNDRVVALVRVFQGRDTPVSPIAMTARILGADDSEPVTVSTTLPAQAFAADRAADYELELPFDRLAPGLHLLSVTAVSPEGRSIRRDVVFRLR